MNFFIRLPLPVEKLSRCNPLLRIDILISGWYIQNSVSKHRFKQIFIIPARSRKRTGDDQSMAKQKEGVYERILLCAKEEFLRNGFQKASLRTIARNAGTSTGSIYTRFGDKQELFDALVGDTAQGLIRWFQDSHQTYHQLPVLQQSQEAFTYGEDKFVWLVDYIYDHYDEFRLIICCSEGSGYEDIENRLETISTDYTYRFIESLDNDAVSSGRLSPSLMHILDSSFYHGVFEIVVHEMSRQEAHQYITQLRRFFLCGWKDIFRLPQTDYNFSESQ